MRGTSVPKRVRRSPCRKGSTASSGPFTQRWKSDARRSARRSAERRAWTRPDKVAKYEIEDRQGDQRRGDHRDRRKIAAARDGVHERLAEERRRKRDRRAAETEQEDDGERPPFAGQVGCEAAASDFSTSALPADPDVGVVAKVRVAAQLRRPSPRHHGLADVGGHARRFRRGRARRRPIRPTPPSARARPRGPPTLRLATPSCARRGSAHRPQGPSV